MGYIPRTGEDRIDPVKEFEIIRTKVKEFKTALIRGRNEEALELFLFIAHDRNVFWYEEDPTEMTVVDDEKLDWFWWEVRWDKDALYHTSPEKAIGMFHELSPEYCLRINDISHTATVALIYAICNNYYDFVKLATKKVELNNLLGVYSEYLLYASGRIKELLVSRGARKLEEYHLVIVDYSIFYLADQEQEEMVKLILEMNADEDDCNESVAEDLIRELGWDAYYVGPFYCYCIFVPTICVEEYGL